MKNIVPCLRFNHNAKEAVDFYCSIFPESAILSTTHYPKTAGEGLLDFQQDLAGDVLTITFKILGQEYMALNAGPDFVFNEAVSFVINCDNQQEIDYYWDTLTKDGGQESVCGRCKDKFGLSRQITPANWEELNKKPGVFAKIMTMKKIIIADLY